MRSTYETVKFKTIGKKIRNFENKYAMKIRKKC